MKICRLRRNYYILPALAVVVACANAVPAEPDAQYSSVELQATNRPESTGEPVPSSHSSAIEAFTGGRTRTVWIRDLGDGSDILGFGGQLLLMGLDTFDDAGERSIVDTPGPYAKPLITPRGDRVLYFNRSDDGVHVVSWNDQTPIRLVDGFPLAAWIDPNTGLEWVYVGTDPRGTDPESYGEVRRHLIDRPDHHELIWNKRAVSGDSFQLSRDGRLAGALARWPAAGVMDLPNGEWRQIGEGCWTSLAGDDSGLFWYFDGQHRNLTMVDTRSINDRRWTVNINSAPGIDGFEVYHPRWSNHARYLTMTGPYTTGGGANKIRGGGHTVEIHVGRFSADYSHVEDWVQITRNDAPDFYPDVWIDPAAAVPSPANLVLDSIYPSGVSSITATPLLVVGRVSEDVNIPTPLDIAPYRNGLLALEYDVLEVIEGAYDETTILVAHWIIRDAKVIPTAERLVGTTIQMSLEPYAAHQELEGERLVSDSDRFDLTLYYDTGSVP